MWRALRIFVLLFILATVAQTAWLARSRTAEWKTSLRVMVYPIAADASSSTRAHVAALRRPSFDDIEAFFAAEAQRHGIALAYPVDIAIAPPVASQPPEPPFGGSTPAIVLWSLKLRYWAWRNDTWKGPRPHVRIFVSYHDPALRERLPHSTGIRKGMIGIVNAFAREDMSGSNSVVIAHELLHTLGATDKYDPATNLPLFPDGYADPAAKPRYPQRQAEIMGGRIARSPSEGAMPSRMKDVVIGEKTAREINWVR